MSAYDYTIDELPIIAAVSDSDLMIVQDAEDTKQTTVGKFKKAFIGDDKEASDSTFYSSSKVESLVTAIGRELSVKASTKELDALQNALKDIAANQIDSDGNPVDIIELIIARDGCGSLKERLERDMQANKNTLLHKYKRTTSGTRINLIDFKGYSDIFLDIDSGLSADITVHSANYFNIEQMRGKDEAYLSYTDYGFIYRQFQISDDKFCGVYVPMNIPTGSYYFSANMYVDEVNMGGQTFQFKPTTVQVSIKYSDRTYSYIDMDIRSIDKGVLTFKFVNNKPVTEIGFLFPEEDFVKDSTLRFENVMVTPGRVLNDFIEYKVEIYHCLGKRYINNLYLERCEVYVEGFASNLIIEYYDNKYSTEFIVDSLLRLQSNVNEDIDQCGLIEDYGLYNYFSNPIQRSDNGMVEVCSADEFVRNGHKSTMVTYTNGDDVVLSAELDEVPSEIETISLLFYVDSTISYYMKEDAIEIDLVSDSVNTYPHNNFYRAFIPRDTIVHGWNTYKFALRECEMIGNPTTITSVTVSFSSNNLIANASVYVNSVVFNQRLKPVVMFTLDGIRDNTFTYTLPLLMSKGYPCTLFMNDSVTLDNEKIDRLISYRVTNTDIGQYGCNPNPENLTKVSNYREQYIALKHNRDYLHESVVYNPVSYSSPSDLRALTVSLLKEMGYGIAKVNVEGSLSFFSKKDMAVPSYRINNNQDIEMLKMVIDDAVKYGKAVCISVYDVSMYGDELNAQQSDFTDIIAHIDEYVSSNQLQVMSMKEFYTKCVK